MSWSSQEVGSGFEVTSKFTGLLSFMLGATETSRYPVVAPTGMVMMIEVLLQELIVTRAPLSVTKLPLSEGPKPVPLICT